MHVESSPSENSGDGADAITSHEEESDVGVV